MKNTILILTLLSFNLSNSQEFSFPINENYNKIIKTLFEGESVSDNECKWKLNVSDKFQFGAFDKDSLYTVCDTIFKFKVNDNLNTLLITSTYGKNETCHACSPSLGIIQLEKNDEENKLIVKDFRKYITKYGTWGEPGKVSLLKIGENEFCIKVSSSYTGMGVSGDYDSLFYNGEKILTYTSYEDNSGSTDEESRMFNYSTKISIDKSFKITLKKIGTEIDEKTGKKIKVNTISNFILLDGELKKL